MHSANPAPGPFPGAYCNSYFTFQFHYSSNRWESGFINYTQDFLTSQIVGSAMVENPICSL